MQKYSKEYFQKMGRKGGKATLKKHGLVHFSKINPKKGKILSQEQAEKEQVVDKVV